MAARCLRQQEKSRYTVVEQQSEAAGLVPMAGLGEAERYRDREQ